MVTVSYQKFFCQDLRAVADEATPKLGNLLMIGVGDWKQRTEDPDGFCSEMKELGIQDRVTIERGQRPGSMLISYQSASGPGSFWFFDDGMVQDGPRADSQVLNMGAYPLIVMWALFGTQALSTEGKETLQSDTAFTSAAEYLRCRYRRGASHCKVEQGRVAKAKQEEELRDAEEAVASRERWVNIDSDLLRRLGLRYDYSNDHSPVNRIDGQHEVSKRIWQKVDTLIAAARQRDDNDSDLDVLVEIVHRYAGARPVATPTTYEAADLQCTYAQQMLKEFEGGKALKSLVLDEGDCSYYSSCHSNEEGSITQCVLGGYAFTSNNCSERKGYDR